jgi:hypothetical protein
VAYEYSSDHRYYTTRFIDGLKDDVKSVVLVQRSVDLDTACSLALLQEEEGVAHHRDIIKPDSPFRQMQYTSYTPLPLPPPPPSWDKSLGGTCPDVKQGVKAACSAPTDKLVALCAYRRAWGLCQFCFEKWSRDYKCVPTMQLQTVQEVWELL